MKNVSQDAVLGLPILIPPLTEQRRIADILGTWDRAIMAAERARDQSERLYLGLADQNIPFHGPTMRPLEDVLMPDRMVVVDADGPFRALGVRSHGKGTFHRIDDLAALGSEKTLYRIEPGRFVVNIVFAWEGAAAITSGEDAGCLVSHRFPTFTINEKLMLPDYLRHMIRMKRFRHLMILASPGGAGRNKTLNRGDLLAMEVNVPALREQKMAAEALSVVERQYLALERYADRLVKQRDALASELLTGRLRVPDAERTAVAV